MDAIISAPSSKSQRHFRKEDVGLSTDIISKLPNDILHHILSFLPTKDLVRTSVLSTRWRYLWTFFSVIDIDLDSLSESHELRTGFLDLVEREMLLSNTARIRKFRLNLMVPIADASDVMLWVDKVMEHKVEELDLSLPVQTFYRLPNRLFASNSLTTLKLDMAGELLFPSSVCFPRLKIFHLAMLEFQSVRSTLKLFDSCPVLEELVLYNCLWGKIGSIAITFPTLKTLSIDYDPLSPEDLLASKIKICAINLLTLKCTSYLTIDLALSNLSSLEDAYIDVMAVRSHNLVPGRLRALKLLHGIQGVKSLTLSNDTISTLSYGVNLHADLPTFHNLKYLQVNWACPEYTPGELIDILQKTPNLHSLSMGEGLEPDALDEENGILNIIPQCFKSSLKRFDISNFDGAAAEVRLLKYFLENATQLENILIFCTEQLSANLEKKEEIKNELELFHRGATSCDIEFS